MLTWKAISLLEIGLNILSPRRIGP